MPGCMRGRRRRHGRHNRTPTYGKHVRTHLARPFGFPDGHKFKRGETFTSTASPAGLPLLIESIMRHLRGLYDELKGPNEVTLSAGRLEAFIRDVQKETPQLLFRETYTFEQFHQLWWTHYSHWKRPIKAAKDLDKPLSQYFINSSHNTYIAEGDQFLGENQDIQYKKVSLLPMPPPDHTPLPPGRNTDYFVAHGCSKYTFLTASQVLENGCRCVEIDVWNAVDPDVEIPQAPCHDKHGPPVQHWTFASTFSWMKARCQTTDRARFTNMLPGKAETFKPKKAVRARAISETELTEARIALLKREPRVCHAYRDVSLSRSIPFRTVCQTIRDAAFKGKNDLPLIISLEVHTTGHQQDLMVDIMKKEWKGLLVDKPLPECDPDTQQPKLRDLKGKILIKVKRGSQHDNPKLKTFESETTLQVSEPFDSASSRHSKVTIPSSNEKQHTENIRRALHELAIYTYSPGPFKDFGSDDAKRPAHVFSFGEEKLKSLHKTKHKDVFKHNRDFLARTFPESISSFLSTNPNYPTLFWRKGVQMVALNWQSWDTAMHLNEAMFDGENGFVLKPPGYQSDSSATCQAEVTGKKRLELCITVLAGQHVPAPKLSDDDLGKITRPNVTAVNNNDFRPRVKGYLHVESPAERSSRRKVTRDQISRRTKAARTENPDWGDGGSKLQFPAVSHVVEELSFVRCVQSLSFNIAAPTLHTCNLSRAELAS